MTSSSSDSEAQPPSGDRLAEIEQLLLQSTRASNERLTQLEQSLVQTEQLTQSNARAIQALTDDLVAFRLTTSQYIEESRQERQESRQERQELRQAMIGVSNLLASLDSDRPTILRKLSTIENKIDRILDRDQNQS